MWKISATKGLQAINKRRQNNNQMKKLLIILSVLAITLTSGQCGEPARVTQGNPIKDFSQIEYFEYSGHSYIRFQEGIKGVDGSTFSIIHNPDCSCFKKDTIK